MTNYPDDLAASLRAGHEAREAEERRKAQSTQRRYQLDDADRRIVGMALVIMLALLALCVIAIPLAVLLALAVRLFLMILGV